MPSTLISNLDYVTICGLRTGASALLISHPHEADPTAPASSPRSVAAEGYLLGLGADASDIYFRYPLSDTSYTLQDTASAQMMLRDRADGPQLESMFQGGLLTFGDGTEVYLEKKSFDDRPIDFTEIPDWDDEIGHSAYGQLVRRKYVEYHDRPFIMLPQQRRSEDVRRELGIPEPGAAP